MKRTGGIPFDEVVRGRRSIRRFQERPVESEIIHEILDLARHAPSSLNGQPWCFIVVRDAATKRRLAEAKNRFSPPDKRGYPADFLASATILLAAHRFGLGSTFLAAYQPVGVGLTNDVRQILGLPVHIDPVSLLPLGYPAESPALQELRPLSEQIHHERFGRLSGTD